jgi:hypothetical protein
LRALLRLLGATLAQAAQALHLLCSLCICLV